jgi:hypothetical protein
MLYLYFCISQKHEYTFSAPTALCYKQYLRAGFEFVGGA